MRILLPPSEAKASAGRGWPLARRLTPANPLAGALAESREQVLAALDGVLAGDRDAAAAALLLPPATVADAFAANARVRAGPTMPALLRYTGVVYQGLDLPSRPAAEQRYALRNTLVFSGLFGVLRGDEPIPTYRVPGKAVLPGLGVLSTWWRARLSSPLGTELATELREGLVVDLRSADYQAMWRPPPPGAERVVLVRVLSPAPRGGYAVISHSSKLAKGRLAAALVRRAVDGGPTAGARDVTAAWLAAGGAGAEQRPGGLDLYTG